MKLLICSRINTRKLTYRYFDFYNPEMHKVSIERARKRYAPYAGTKIISTAAVPLEHASVDVVLLCCSGAWKSGIGGKDRFF